MQQKRKALLDAWWRAYTTMMARRTAYWRDETLATLARYEDAYGEYESAGAALDAYDAQGG